MLGDARESLLAQFSQSIGEETEQRLGHAGPEYAEKVVDQAPGDVAVPSTVEMERTAFVNAIGAVLSAERRILRGVGQPLGPGTLDTIDLNQDVTIDPNGAFEVERLLEVRARSPVTIYVAPADTPQDLMSALFSIDGSMLGGLVAFEDDSDSSTDPKIDEDLQRGTYLLRVLSFNDAEPLAPVTVRVTTEPSEMAGSPVAEDS